MKVPVYYDNLILGYMLGKDDIEPVSNGASKILESFLMLTIYKFKPVRSMMQVIKYDIIYVGGLERQLD
jgi:hypothetical protein